jgi:tRNA-splicing ligase RtcB (3'-phosphate/5'-hydroxy nucleic acid ligase)
MPQSPNGPIELPGTGTPIKAWVKGVLLDPNAEQQLRQTAELPFIYKWLAAMPDVHFGRGATVGSVIPTKGAVIPAAVGVDIGCGMCAVRTSLAANDLPDSLKQMRKLIEQAVPVGFTDHSRTKQDRHWEHLAQHAERRFKRLAPEYESLTERYPSLRQRRHPSVQLGTLGGGNHFIEVCLDEEDRVWIMLHSGSRGIGNQIGQVFITKAKQHMEQRDVHLTNKDLAWLDEGTAAFEEYVEAVSWAQEFAAENRRAMLAAVTEAVARTPGLREFTADEFAVNCHHNYIAKEHHFGEDVYVTRKGAVRAGKGDLGIIPGSMGTRSFIVRGLGNPDSFESCSHGAGRVMSRTAARKQLSVQDHVEATAGVECRKDAGVLDETPAAYKPIDGVMAAQSDLVEIVHELKQVVCVKG